MKKLALAVLVLAVIAAGSQSFAATASDRGKYELSGAIDYGSGPDVFDANYGITFGGGYMLDSIDRNLQARLDVSYFPYNRNVFNTNVDFTRIPINLSGRYYIPMSGEANLFAEAGVEISVDDKEYVDLFGVKHSQSDTRWGFTPGVGAEYYVGPKTSLFVLGRLHVITDNYFSAHFGAAYHF